MAMQNQLSSQNLEKESAMDGQSLREKLRSVREGMDQNDGVRLHRAVSWLRCAEQYRDSDEDMALIASWISFNACYAIDDANPDHRARDDFNSFSERLCEADQNNEIYTLLWTKYSQFVRAIINNQFVFEPFWRAQRGACDDWETRFDASKKLAMYALANNDTPKLLSIVLDRLYVIRNQLVHGGATHCSQVNRAQVRDGKNLLLELMPIVILLIMENTDVDWGAIYYPVVE